MSGPFKMLGHELPGPNQRTPAKYEKDPESLEMRKKIERYHKPPSPTGRSIKTGPPESPEAIKTKKTEYTKTVREQGNTPIGSAENKALSDKSWKQSRELNEAEKYIRK